MSRVDDIRGRVKAATPGPWFRFIDDAYEDGPAHIVYTAPGDTVALTGHGPRDGSASRDAALIANAPADLAYLLERNAVLEATVRAVEDIHFNEDHLCGQCANKYPCETIRAIRARADQAGGEAHAS